MCCVKIRGRESFSSLSERLSLSSARTMSPKTTPGPLSSAKTTPGPLSSAGSAHTETIVTGDLAAARSFVAGVDSSAVIVNASTRFNDGGQLGLGAEIGISTDKYHARGPCGLRELTSTKWIVFGDGQVRE